MMGIHLLHGDPHTALSRPDGLVLPRTTAMEIFGREDVVGERVTIQLPVQNWAKITCYVSGVMEEYPLNAGTTLSNLALLPLACVPPGYWDWNPYNRCELFYTADKPEIVEQLLSQRLSLDKQPLRAAPMRMKNVMMGKRSLWEGLSRPVQFAGLSLLLLIAALFNYIALLTSYWMGRKREYRLRLSLGGTWRSNMGWLYAEVGIMLTLVALCSLPALQFLVHFADMPRECSTPFTALLCVLPVFAAVTLQAALYPLWYIHRISRQASLHDGRPLLLGIQIGIGAVMLFVFSGMFSQFRFMMQGNLGFDMERVLQVNPEGTKDTGLELIRQRGTDCVEDAIGTPKAILDNRKFWGEEHLVHEATHDTVFSVLPFIATPETFKFFNIRAVEGELPVQEREHSWDNKELYHVAVNRDLVEAFPPGTVKIGTRLKRIDSGSGVLSWGEYEVCGIVDVERRALNEANATPTFFYILPESMSLEKLYVRYKPGKMQEATALVRDVLKELGVPEHKIDVKSMSDYLAEKYEGDRKQLSMFSIIAAAAVLVLLFGMYSFVAFVLNSHRRSIAVRRVFGATKADLYRKYLRTYVSLTAAACLLAFPAARWLCGLWLRSFRNSVQIGWPHFLLIVLSLSALVAVVVDICLRRTLSENPADVIKEE